MLRDWGHEPSPRRRPSPDGTASGADRSQLRPAGPWRIGVDVGGTFTDLVLADDHGDTWVAKVPSVPADPSRGVHAALARVAVEAGLPLDEVLRDCSLFVHGSTVATNTMLEGTGAAVGLIGTDGFRDTLEIRRGLREDQWNHRAPYAPVMVPRYLRTTLGGRIDADGTEHAPLDLSGLGEILDRFDSHGVEAVAIALMNSFVDDAHEQAAAEAVREQWDGDWVTASAAVSPLMGEYERTSTAVVNASLSPKIVSYLQSLNDELAAAGLRHSILLVQSNGGAASVDQLSERPVNLLLSGPAAAVGALNLYREAVDTALAGSVETPDGAVTHAAAQPGNLISMEIGGTSCDVLLMSGGEVDTRDEIMIAGYHVSTPAIDIHTIGAGGGTIAGVDEAGLLYVGPQGAGAVPGPACYGSGGELPTVTDAQLVLGRLRPGKSTGGTLDLGHRRCPRGNPHPRRRAARHDCRRGCRRDRGGRRAASAQRHRAHLDRTRPLAPTVHDGRGRRGRTDAWRLRCRGTRLRACLCAPRRRCAVCDRDAARRCAAGFHPLPDGLARRNRRRRDRRGIRRTAGARARGHGCRRLRR